MSQRGKKRSSFTRKVKGPALPKGTKVSVHNGTVLTSSGLPDLDLILGGGVPLGSVVVVHEDTQTHFYNHVLKYYLSEGASQGQVVHMVSGDTFHTAGRLVSSLPRNVTLEEAAEAEAEAAEAEGKSQQGEGVEEDGGTKNGGEEMKIAWQYEKYVKASEEREARKRAGLVRGASSGAVYCHTYDLSRTMQEEVEGLKGIGARQLREEAWEEGFFGELADEVQGVVGKGRGGGEAKTRVVRLCVGSFGSVLWGDMAKSERQRELVVFLRGVRGLLRSSEGSHATLMVSVPVDGLDASFVRRVDALADAVVSLKSFASEEGASVAEPFQDYQGMLYVRKLPVFNSLRAQAPAALEHLFRVKRRKMVIEKFYLPPEVSRSTSAATAAAKKENEAESGASSSRAAKEVTCGSLGGSTAELDF